jgi:hypothetical protein
MIRSTGEWLDIGGRLYDPDQFMPARREEKNLRVKAVVSVSASSLWKRSATSMHSMMEAWGSDAHEGICHQYDHCWNWRDRTGESGY